MGCAIPTAAAPATVGGLAHIASSRQCATRVQVTASAVKVLDAFATLDGCILLFSFLGKK